ncbi:succinate dehydrogenase assembly factor 2 [Nitratireductor sp. GISD-1A_MAKvit]|uniref:FAD assembly factor SdhE n=1 Tax=Nitratireductor sp. GISD-1A_MAKvit TaxID=3234198 RepID=UPI003467D5BF
MTGTTRSSHDLDPRRRRALVRAWRRGMREMDLVLGGFADAEIDRLSNDEMDQFEAILSVPDTNLFKWVTGEMPVPADYDTPLWGRIIASQGR